MKLIIHPATSLRGTVALPGDKSISHRALILGAMAAGKTVAHNWLNAGVTDRMVDCIRALGIEVHFFHGAVLVIYRSISKNHSITTHLYAGRGH